MSSMQERLDAAKLALQQAEAPYQGVGTLQEKQLHAILKYYYEPDPAYHEVPCYGFIADIRTPEGITEIQTRSFSKLRRKLAVFLKSEPVTLVYPLPYHKWVRWVDPETGEITAARKSPKTGQPADACFELNMIQDLLGHERLHIRLLLLDIEEYRILNGWSRDRKKGATRAERLPLTVIEEIYLDRPSDYLQLLPEGLPSPFTSTELSQFAHLSTKRTQWLLHCLRSVRQVQVSGKIGRKYLYQISNGKESDLLQTHICLQNQQEGQPKKG